MSHQNFVHLHLHTDYSLLDGACEISRLVDLAARNKMPAVAVTDHGNLFAAVQFYNAALARGVKPIIGCETYVARGSRLDRATDGERANHLVLLCENDEGYRNLVKLVSSGFLEGFYYKPRIDKELLAQHSRGLIALSSCLRGEVASALLDEDYEGARRAAGELEDIFAKGNFFLEIQDQGLEAEHRINPSLVRLARETGIPLVATNDCHYLRPQDARAHDVLLCIQTGKTLADPNRMKFGSDQFYFKSYDDMMQVFGEIPDAVMRTVAIAERCHMKLEKVAHPFPHFEVPEGYSLESYLEKVTREGFEERRRHLEEKQKRGLLRHSLKEYEERLHHELEMIKKMRFAGYFLIVWDFIRYAREQGIPVGPGRGSAAGSLVSYALRITDIDPLEHVLLFERFLNPERVSLPDIDIDFCMRRRGEVINYVTQKYGRDNVAQIITFGTMAAKAAIKDVGRVLEMPYGEVDRIAKLVPSVLNITIEQALEQSPQLKALVEREARVKELIEIAKRLEGFVRHASTHAAGVVISPEPLTEIVPLYKTNREEIVTQYAMNDLEKIGLLKMDFLALATLTVVDDSLKLIVQNRGQTIRLEEIPLDDAKTYDLFSQGLTSGVFQFESAGMRDILRRYQPTRLEDLTALNALYRPGPIQGGMTDDFIERRHGRRKITYEVPELKEILEETYGVMVYQEQVMQIANRLAGFSLGEADLLRRAMGKKRPEEMAAQREKFLAGCRAHRIPEKKAARIFDLMEQFAGYGFNKSHSAAYALLAYHTAYLKTHYPIEFMAALLTSETGNTDKVVKYINECREMGITVLPPDVNTSSWNFTPSGQAVRFGLGAIKNVGYNTIQAILEARVRTGQLRSLFQFAEEVDVRLLNRRVLESLVKAGAMDSLGGRRAQLVAAIDAAIERAQRKQRDRQSGQHGLFAGGPTRAVAESETLPDVEEWPEHTLLSYEKETLGFFISGHPLARFAERLRELQTTEIAGLESRQQGEDVVLAGILLKVRSLRTKKGDRMAMATLEDMSGTVEMIVFPESFKRYEPVLRPDAPLVVRGRVNPEEAGTRIIVAEISPLDEASGPASRITIRMDLERVSEMTVAELVNLFRQKPGSCRVAFELEQPRDYRVLFEPRREWRVNPDEDFLERLRSICGESAVELRR